MSNLNITLHHGDLPADVLNSLGNVIAMDCEMMGLDPIRDKLCLVQLSDNGKDIHLVKFDITQPYNASNLAALLEDESKEKIFHFAVADMGTLIHHLNISPKNIFCTKMASKLCRTYTEAHGLKANLKDMLDIELPKEFGSSHWGVSELSEGQLGYAASDVEHLHALKAKLVEQLELVGRVELHKETCKFIPTLAKLELQGWDSSILNHH